MIPNTIMSSTLLDMDDLDIGDDIDDEEMMEGKLMLLL